MAASLSRPDPSSPASVAEAGFSTGRRGYSQDEVRAFLTSVAAELGRLKERERQLEAELRQARDVEPAEVELDDETVTRLLGEETLRVLQTARESASQIKIRAEESAARILRDANDEVNRLRQDAEVEAARKRQDATSDAEAEVALAKQQGREMVTEARAYRERVLADLERRTKLARQNIEELKHGRDRLLQVFERARLVAVDVTSELADIEGPDDDVSFSPTTGPVPLMVPAASGAALPTRAEPAADRPSAEAADGDDDPVDDVAEPITDQSEPESGEVADQATDPTVVAEGEPGVDSDAAADEVVSDPHDQPESADAPRDDGDTGNDHTSGDGADDDHEDADLDPAERPAAKRPDGNVVSLFRGRGPDASDDAEIDADDERDDADGDAPTLDDQATDDESGVDEHDATDADAAEAPTAGLPGDDAAADIFAKLRSGTPTVEEAASAVDGSTGETAPDAPTDDAPTDDATPDDAAVDEAASEETGGAEAMPEPTAFSRRDEALVPLIVTGARKLKRVLADEQNGVLDALRQSQPATTLDDVLPGADDHIDRYLAAIADELLEAAATGAAEFGANDTKTLRRKLDQAGAVDAARSLVRTDLIVPLRDRLERSISEGSGDNEEITKRVRSVYREWKTQHIDDQLDDVFRFAHGGGLSLTVEPGTAMVWTIDADQPACPDCEDNSLAGPVSAGDAYPTGHTSAPAHPGCRCLTLPTDQ